MIIHDNIVSDDLIKSTIKEFDSKDWRSSDEWTDQDVTRDRPIFHKSVQPSKLHNALEEYLSPVFLETSAKKILYNYYIWKIGCSLEMHRDKDYSFGATLYLNSYWSIHWGGLFIWQEKDTENLKAICPSQGTLVINDKQENHAVTTVTELAEYDRLTVQIWGVK